MILRNFSGKMLCYLSVKQSVDTSFITALYRVKENVIFM
jgi:hypothetical protein